MPFYQTKGSIPRKRHTVFKNKNKICYEELVSREGFSSIYTNLYHLNMPTRVKKVGKMDTLNLVSYNKNDLMKFRNFGKKWDISAKNGT